MLSTVPVFVRTAQGCSILHNQGQVKGCKRSRYNDHLTNVFSVTSVLERCQEAEIKGGLFGGIQRWMGWVQDGRMRPLKLRPGRPRSPPNGWDTASTYWPLLASQASPLPWPRPYRAGTRLGPTHRQGFVSLHNSQSVQYFTIHWLGSKRPKKHQRHYQFGVSSKKSEWGGRNSFRKSILTLSWWFSSTRNWDALDSFVEWKGWEKTAPTFQR